MTQDKETAELIAVARAAEERLSEAAAALRVASRAVNTLGVLASEIQREAQDIEFAAAPELKVFLDGSLIQRTGFVNSRSAQVAEQLRHLTRGVSDLLADCKRAIVLASGGK